MPRSFRRSVLLTGAGVTALALTLAGCSSSPSPAPTPADTSQAPTPQETISAAPAAFIAQASDATRAAGSARIATTMTVESGDKQVGTISAKGDGVIDFANQNLDITMTMDMMGMNQEIQILMVDGTSYMKMSMLGDKWIQADPDQVGATMQDPSQSLEQLKELANLKEAGTEEVNGASATKYTGTIDIREALTAAGLPEEQLAELGDDLSKIGKSAAVAVWVDDQDRVVRMDQALSANIPEAGKMSIKSSTTLSDFGVATNITPPPASEVTQMPTMPSPAAS